MSSSKQSGFTHESARNESIEWYTPPVVFDMLGHDVLFDLDPCSSEGGVGSVVPANHRFDIHTDGLAQDWSEYGTVFMNPPYNREVVKWMAKLQEHGDGIALVFSRTDTKWFQKAMETAECILFIRGRIRFIDGRTGEPAKSGAGAPSCFVAFGQAGADILRAAVQRDPSVGFLAELRLEPDYVTRSVPVEEGGDESWLNNLKKVIFPKR